MTSRRGGSDPAPPARTARVLPDVAAIDKEFDYLVPDGVEVHVGDLVRIELHGRRVGGWIVALDVEPIEGVKLKPLAKVSSRGPTQEIIDLAGWAAWRWAGRRASFLRTASPPGVVRSVGELPPSTARPGATPTQIADDLHAAALARRLAVLRLPPGADRYPLARAAVIAAQAEGGSCLVLCPSVEEAQELGRRLRLDGLSAAVVAQSDARSRVAAGEWTMAAAGAAAVIGARAGAWAPVRNLRRVLVFDEHDESYQQEQAPTWHARDVAVERAVRLGVPALLVSPCPTLEALSLGELIVTDRVSERRGWSRLEVVDQRETDPSLGLLFSPRLVELVRGPGRVVCVLNRTGRARLLACTSCTTLARCGNCDSAVADNGSAQFECGRCTTTRPVVCLQCGGARFKNLRLGVSRASEELAALVAEPVAEVTAGSPIADHTRVVIGTEAVLHRVARADSVAFLDFDQELLAPRYRGAEQALAMLARATRLTQRANAPTGRLLVQTRSPDHPVIVAAREADPGRLAASELPLRSALGLPPTTAMALVSGAVAAEFIAAFGQRDGVRVQGPVDDVWRLVAPDHQTLCDALGAVTRPPGRLRVEVDPLRI